MTETTPQASRPRSALESAGRAPRALHAAAPASVLLVAQAGSEAASPLEAIQGLPPIDIFGLGVVAILVVLGLWRGLWWQVIRFVGLVAAVALARVFSPEASQWMQESWQYLAERPRLAHGLSWGAVFLVALGAASILGLLGQKILETIQLGLVNRLAGALLGALTGVIVHVAILVFLCQLAPEAFVSKHVTGTYSEEILARTGSRWRIVLGAEAADEIDRLLARPGTGGLFPTIEPEPESPEGSQATTTESDSEG